MKAHVFAVQSFPGSLYGQARRALKLAADFLVLDRQEWWSSDTVGALLQAIDPSQLGVAIFAQSLHRSFPGRQLVTSLGYYSVELVCTLTAFGGGDAKLTVKLPFGVETLSINPDTFGATLACDDCYLRWAAKRLVEARVMQVWQRVDDEGTADGRAGYLDSFVTD